MWRDENRDGIGAGVELHNLTAKGVRSFDLHYVQLQDCGRDAKRLGCYEYDVYGNTARQRSVMELDDGTQRLVVDMWFRSI